MNERIRELVEKSYIYDKQNDSSFFNKEKFAELIVKEMCSMMEQVEDDAYHCFDASERPTEYIAWLNQWRTRFEKHFGVEE